MPESSEQGHGHGVTRREVLIGGLTGLALVACSGDRAPEVDTSSFPIVDLSRLKENSPFPDAVLDQTPTVVGVWSGHLRGSGVVVYVEGENRILTAGHMYGASTPETKCEVMDVKTQERHSSRFVRASAPKGYDPSVNTHPSIDPKSVPLDIVLADVADPHVLPVASTVADHLPTQGSVVYGINYQKGNDGSFRTPGIQPPEQNSGVVVIAKSGIMYVLSNNILQNGASGGPLFDEKGKVIGISVDMRTAVPASTLANALGVRLRSADPDDHFSVTFAVPLTKKLVGGLWEELKDLPKQNCQ
jgi:hypothetical protein